MAEEAPQTPHLRLRFAATPAEFWARHAKDRDPNTHQSGPAEEKIPKK